MGKAWSPIGKVIGYAAFFAACLAVLLYLFFPSDRLRGRLLAGFDRFQRDRGMNLQLRMGRLAPRGLFTLSCRGVDIIAPPTAGPDGIRRPGFLLPIEEAWLGLSPWELIRGRKVYRFSGDLLGGSLEGKLQKEQEEWRLEVRLEAIELEGLSLSTGNGVLPVQAAASGRIGLRFGIHPPWAFAGEFRVSSPSLRIGNGAIRLPDFPEVPALEAGVFLAEGSLSGPLVTFARIEAEGKDIELSGEGELRMGPELTIREVDLRLRFRPTDRYRLKDEKLRLLFEAGRPSGSPLIETLSPTFRKAKDGDGFYAWRIARKPGQAGFRLSPDGEATRR